MDIGKPAVIQRNDKILRINFKQEPLSLDPRKGSDPISPALHVMTLQGLTRMTPEDPRALSLAKNIEISEDRKTYTFTLKKAFWSDQSPITSYDFAKTWKEVLDPHFPSPVAHLFFVIKNAEKAFRQEISLDDVGIHTPNDKTIVVELEHPIPYFLDLTSFSAFYAVKYDENKKHELLCSGPFLLKKWLHNDQLVLEKNPYFWDAKNVHLEGIHVSIVASDVTSLTMFENKEIDFVGGAFSPLPLDTLQILSKRGMIHSSPLGATTMLTFNVDKFPYTNKNIRKAIACAVNRKELVDNITQLGEIVATDFIPPVLKKKDPKELLIDANNDLSRELFKKGLDELKIAKEDFPSIQISYYNEDCYAKIAQAIQQQLHEVLGIQVDLYGYELQYFLQKMRKKDFQVAEFSWSAQYNDPMNILERFKSKHNIKNYSGWENRDYIDLLNDSLHLFSPVERIQFLEKAEEILAEDMPFTCLYHWHMNYLLQPHVKGFYISPIGSLHWEFVSIDPELA